MMRRKRGAPAPWALEVLPNPSLHSDPVCFALRPLSMSRFLGSARRLGAGGAGWLCLLGAHDAFRRPSLDEGIFRNANLRTRILK